MRSADRLRLAFGAVAATTALVGCGSIKLPAALGGPAPVTAPPSAPASAASTASAAAAAAGTTAPSAVAAAPAAPVNPASQQAYDAALAALRAGRTADAERGFKALAQSDPDLAGPHANLGLIARQAGRLPDAVAELERATTLSPRLAPAWNQLGLAYRQQGRFDKARAAYEQALAADPNYANAVLNLGVLDDLYLGDGAQALELYTRYLALVPAGDATVAKWVADLKNRKPAATPGGSAASAPGTGAPKEKS